MRRRARLGLLVVGALAACSGGAGDTADTVGPADGSATTTDGAAPTQPAEPGSAAAVELRPVIAGPQPCDALDPEATVLPILPEIPGAACVEVGPTAIDGTDLARAEATLGGSSGDEWVVEVDVAEGARDDANAVFDACVARDPSCPTALVAIVIDGEVVSAPSVTETGLADLPFVISGGRAGGFSQAEAEGLAERIEG